MIRITWLGHSGVGLAARDCQLLIDPWITGNPVGAPLPEDFAPNLILATHGHSDHLGDAIDLAKRFDVPLLASPEIAAFAAKAGAKTELINYGGTFHLDHAWIKCVIAFHSSSLGSDRLYGGNPCGFIIRMDDTTIYHAGDTCLFGDMRIIAEMHPLDLAFLPIGGRVTMDAAEALAAVKLLQPRYVAPVHFGTWDFIAQDPDAFAADVTRETAARAMTMTPGKTFAFPPGDGGTTSVEKGE